MGTGGREVASPPTQGLRVCECQLPGSPGLRKQGPGSPPGAQRAARLGQGALALPGTCLAWSLIGSPLGRGGVGQGEGAKALGKWPPPSHPPRPTSLLPVGDHYCFRGTGSGEGTATSRDWKKRQPGRAAPVCLLSPHMRVESGEASGGPPISGMARSWPPESQDRKKYFGECRGEVAGRVRVRSGP